MILHRNERPNESDDRPHERNVSFGLQVPRRLSADNSSRKRTRSSETCGKRPYRMDRLLPEMPTCRHTVLRRRRHSSRHRRQRKTPDCLRNGTARIAYSSALKRQQKPWKMPSCVKRHFPWLENE